MRAFRIAALTLLATFATASAFAAVSNADPLAAVDLNRNAIIADIVQGFDGDRAALGKRLAGLRADRLLSASLASTRESLESILAEAEKSRDATASRAGAKVLGSANSDLVYTPIAPCRLIDTRGLGAPIQGGPFAPGERRAYVPNGLCSLPTIGVASMLISFTTLNLTPNSGGYLSILGPGAPVATSVDIFNFGTSWSGSNTAVVTGPAAQFDVFVSTANPQVVIDILGYFAPPTGTVVKSVTAGTGLTGGTITDTGTVAIAGAYQLPQACTNGQVPQSNGASAWTCVTPPTATSGTVTSVASGTGLTGGTITNTGTLALATAFQLPQACTNGQVAQSNGAGVWSCVTPPTPTGGTVTGVTATPPLASTGGPAPNISLNGVVDVVNGGTSQSAFPFGGILFGTGTGPLGAVGPGFAGQVLVASGGPPSWNDSLSLNGSLNLAFNSNPSQGNILKGGTPFIHNSGLDSLFAGLNAGNFGGGGTSNTGIGTFALQSLTVGFQNTAVGARALASNASGASNTAVGYQALNFNGSGSANTAIGRSTMVNNTTGIANTAIGNFALGNNTSGASNTAGGYQALTTNNGDSNTAFGNFALGNNIASFNVAVGDSALGNNTTGASNIGIGTAAGINLTTGSQNIAIGNAGVGGDAFTIRIGTNLTQNRAFIAGIRGTTTGIANGVAVLIDSNGQLGTTSSSRRFKDDVADMDASTEALMKLRPVTFHYKSDQSPSGRTLQYGLIAEEVAEVYPGLVAHSADGEVETVMYQYLPPMLLNEHQKLRRTVEAQAAEIAALKRAVAEIADLKRTPALDVR